MTAGQGRRRDNALSLPAAKPPRMLASLVRVKSWGGKPMSQRSAVLLAVLVSWALARTATAAPGSCTSATFAGLPDTTITSAAVASADPLSGAALPAYCRVVGVIKPTADSNIGFETWLPLSGWNGKYNTVGGGGFAGSISYDALDRALARGYAAASTDTGHIGGDASWAFGHPE